VSSALPPTFREALRAWTRVALSSFGGPAGQIAVIHRIIVEEQRWIDERRFLHALTYCMLLPGPEAQQLATYLGWTLHGTRGALAAGTLFVLPGFLAILALSLVYVRYGDTGLVAGVFLGLKPAVLAVVLVAFSRFRRRALERRHGASIALGAFVLMFAFHTPFPAVIAGAALLGYLLYRWSPDAAEADLQADSAAGSRPASATLLRTVTVWLAIWLDPIVLLALLLPSQHVLVKEALFFSKVAVVTFGGAYAVLSYVAQQAVEGYAWVTPAQMLDGLGLAESTPGPLIMVVQFVGFLGAYANPGGLDPLAAGVLGALITTWVTFVPCFLFILAGAPYVEYLRGNRALSAALTGVLAAVAGVVLNLAVWFGVHTLFGATRIWEFGPLRVLLPDPTSVEWTAVLIAAASLVALVRFRAGLLTVLTAAALTGVAVRLLAP
jgi:chromate transporter